MKKNTLLSCLTLLAAIAGTSVLHSQVVTYTFTDPSLEEGDVASVFVGDVIGGDVVIDLSDGSYTVTWVSNPWIRFFGNESFQLILGNIQTGQTVSLVLNVPNPFPNPPEMVVYEGVQPELTTWQAGDEIVTAGGAPEFAGNFVSRVVSLNLFLPPGTESDQVRYAGFLEGEEVEIVDTDGDGIPDEEDPNPDSDLSETVSLLGVETGIDNLYEEIEELGVTLADKIQSLESSAAESAKNSGDYVQTLSKDFKELVRAGYITDRERARLMKIISANR